MDNDVETSSSQIRKLRPRKKARPSYELGSDAEESDNASDVEFKKPVRARGPRASGSGSGVNGAGKTKKAVKKYANIMDIPLDVAFEIFGYLPPYDVLRLARTNKGLRKSLLSRSAYSLWKRAFANVPGLPEPFEGTSLPSWVNLLFDNHCHFCNKVNLNIDFLLRVRACRQCAVTQMAKSTMHWGWNINPDGTEEGGQFKDRVLQGKLIPLRYVEEKKPTNYPSEAIYRASEMDEILAEYELIPKDDPEAQKVFATERKKRMVDMMTHEARCKRWHKEQVSLKGSQNDALREERYTAIVAKLKELGFEDELKGIKRPDSLRDHKQVDKPQRLTERIWANIKPEILEFMEEMTMKRLDREYTAAVETFKVWASYAWGKYKWSLPAAERLLLPSPIDYIQHAPIMALIKDLEEDPKRSAYNPLKHETIPAFIAEHREKIVKSLCAQLRQPWRNRSSEFGMMGYRRNANLAPSEYAEYGNQEILNRLSLASTVFICSSCYIPPRDPDPNGNFIVDSSPSDDDLPSDHETPIGQGRRRSTPNPLFYPDAVSHRCLVHGHYRPYAFSRPRPTEPSISYVLSYHAWNPRNLQINKEMSKVALDFIGLLYPEEPEKVTIKNMDGRDARFICVHPGCAAVRPRPEEVAEEEEGEEEGEEHVDSEVEAGSNRRPMFNWRAVIKHHRVCHLQCTDPDDIKALYLVKESTDLPHSIREAEEEHFKMHKNGWVCVRCRHFCGNYYLHKVKEHLKISHSIDEPVEDGDYARDDDWNNLYTLKSFFVKVDGESGLVVDE